MAAIARHLVSKKKRRYINEEHSFDLDLSYIECQKMGRKIIAMGFPSSGFEARYRNPLPEVQRFFKTFHEGRNRIYNLCSERDYKLDGLFDEVNHMFAFDDHNPCPLDLILPFCENVSAYLEQHADNVVGIHCKAGKGRTGMLICCFLVFKGYPARDALGIFADQRTHNSKGVTIPSQIRYVYYLEEMLRPRAAPTVELVPGSTFLPRAPVYKIFLVKLITTPNFDTYGGCDPYFKIATQKINQSTGLKEKTKVVFDLKKAAGGRCPSVKKGVPYVSLNCNEHPVLIQGDVQMVRHCGSAQRAAALRRYRSRWPLCARPSAQLHPFPHRSTPLSLFLTPSLALALARSRSLSAQLLCDHNDLAKDEKMCGMWFNTHFIHNGYLCFHKQVVDKACKDKKHSNFDEGFKLEIYFERVDAASADAAEIVGGDDDVGAAAGGGGGGGGGGSHDSEW